MDVLRAKLLSSPRVPYLRGTKIRLSREEQVTLWFVCCVIGKILDLGPDQVLDRIAAQDRRVREIARELSHQLSGMRLSTRSLFLEELLKGALSQALSAYLGRETDRVVEELLSFKKRLRRILRPQLDWMLRSIRDGVVGFAEETEPAIVLSWALIKFGFPNLQPSILQEACIRVRVYKDIVSLARSLGVPPPKPTEVGLPHSWIKVRRWPLWESLAYLLALATTAPRYSSFRIVRIPGEWKRALLSRIEERLAICVLDFSQQNDYLYIPRIVWRIAHHLRITRYQDVLRCASQEFLRLFLRFAALIRAVRKQNSSVLCTCPPDLENAILSLNLGTRSMPSLLQVPIEGDS